MCDQFIFIKPLKYQLSYLALEIFFERLVIPKVSIFFCVWSNWVFSAPLIKKVCLKMISCFKMSHKGATCFQPITFRVLLLIKTGISTAQTRTFLQFVLKGKCYIKHICRGTSTRVSRGHHKRYYGLKIKLMGRSNSLGRNFEQQTAGCVKIFRATFKAIKKHACYFQKRIISRFLNKIRIKKNSILHFLEV